MTHLKPNTSLDPAILAEALERGGTLLVGPREDKLTAADIEAAFKWAFPRATKFPPGPFLGQTALAAHFLACFDKRRTRNRRYPMWRLADFVAQTFRLDERDITEEAVVTALRSMSFGVERVLVSRGQYYWAVNIKIGTSMPRNEMFRRTVSLREVLKFGALPPIKVWGPK